MTLSICQNPQNCTPQNINFTGYKIFPKINQNMRKKIRIQTMTNKPNCITNESCNQTEGNKDSAMPGYSKAKHKELHTNTVV